MKTIRKIGILLLAAVLCCSLVGCMPLGRAIMESVEESVMDYMDAQDYTAGGFAYAAGDVNRVAVSWVGGSVTLVEGAGETLHAAESGTLSTAQQMHRRIKDGKLEIMFCASGYIGNFPQDSKALTLEIPAGADVTVDSVSAPINGSALHVGALALTTVSGAVHLDTVTAADIAVESTSGAVSLEGETTAEETALHTISGAVRAALLHGTSVRAETVSGGVQLGLGNCAEADVSTVSGAVLLAVPTAHGATFRYSTVSGSLHCDDYRVKDDTCIFGGGACDARVSTVSGSLTVQDK